MLTAVKMPIQSLSLFFPVYNEAAVLPELIAQARTDLRQLGIPHYELIIVDDGSRDGSAAIADSLARQWPEVRVIHHAVNRGYGGALLSGFAAARYDWVLYIDGDGQFNVADLGRFMPLAKDHHVILGYRIQREDHFGRKVNAALWGGLLRIVLGVNVRDVDCGFKLIRRQALQYVRPLESQGAVISAELLVKLRRQGLKFAEVGVTHYPRRSGEPTGANIAVIMRAVRELLQLRYRLWKQY